MLPCCSVVTARRRNGTAVIEKVCRDEKKKSSRKRIKRVKEVIQQQQRQHKRHMKRRDIT
jgi:hypothetical protein